MIRAIALLCFWGLSILLVGPPLVLYAALTGNLVPLYYIATRLGGWGVQLVGVRIEVRGREHLQPGRNYIFMSNHASNLDPPVLIPVIPGRCSVLVKKELFRVPVLGTGMRLSHLVPVDRGDQEAAIESVRAATDVLRQGFHMVIYPEGTRTSDGHLLPFKKGPFHLAMDSGVPVVPVTILGTYESWPKTRFALRPGTVTVIFHSALDPHKYTDREALMRDVRNAISGSLPA
ncbi:MAG TPA: lysophospholipid acyltransferase family protein [Terriglobales bacterium]|nr:lysophospholipid acyltransferase family protein [Terriglobales bacterium]